jgi:serine/threonine protein kinase/Flp pilus assembly protein TadD
MRLEPSAGRPSDRPAKSSRGGKAPPDFVGARSVKRQLLGELTDSHDRGAPVQPEDLLVRWPTDATADRDFASLLYEDYCRREQSGDQPSLADYQQRFPSQRDSLIAQLRQNGVLRSLRVSGSEPAPLSLPVVGDELFGFRLRHELGAGAFASVFLAEQVALAGRPVVLKVSAAEGQEPQTLAQLQHTHIVPIYSQHEHAAAGLRAVCMPFFGGAALSRVLGAMWVATSQPKAGAELVRALALVAAPSLDDLSQARAETAMPTRERTAAAAPAAAAPLTRLAAGTFIEATAWIGACLADGLHHARQRGILHRDIKPSNILLGADGQPLLLDFNLSANLKDVAGCGPTGLGGTVAYMAPEHLRAMAARDPALARKVDHRSDIYSLGMVLYEMLVGHKPFDQSASYAPMPALIEAMAVERAQTIPSVREYRLDVPWGLESIVRKCLDPDPDKRYQQADQLADDLRALLADRPLQHAPELSRVECVRKWSRRHPRLATAVTAGAIALMLVALLGGSVAVLWHGLANTREQLASAEERALVQQFDDDTIRAFSLVSTTTDLHGYDHLRPGLALCRKNLDRFGVLDHDDWQQMPAWQRMDAGRRAHLLDSVREVLLLYAWARARSESWRVEALEEALALVARAERIVDLPPTAALSVDRAFYLAKLGRGDEAAAARARAERTPPATARDYYLLATTRIRTEGPASPAALALLNRALALNPQHFWALMQRGVCRLEASDQLLAISDFSEAIRVQPASPIGHFNRGAALTRAGRHDAAIVDYTRALQCDEHFVLAYLNRGLSYLELRQYGPAIADFNEAVALGRDDAALHAGRGIALEGLGNGAEADVAFAQALDRLGTLDSSARVHLLWSLGNAFAPRRPDRAAAAFDLVLATQPRQPQALYGRAMLAAQADRLEAALSYFHRALEADPAFTEARRYRAILLARTGQLAQANQDINMCLEKEPGSGPTLYAAACVAALALEQTSSDNVALVARQALSFLEKALQHGYGQDRAAQDPDLAALRHMPAFQQILARNMR